MSLGASQRNLPLHFLPSSEFSVHPLQLRAGIENFTLGLNIFSDPSKYLVAIEKFFSSTPPHSSRATNPAVFSKLNLGASEGETNMLTDSQGTLSVDDGRVQAEYVIITSSTLVGLPTNGLPTDVVVISELHTRTGESGIEEVRVPRSSPDITLMTRSSSRSIRTPLLHLRSIASCLSRLTRLFIVLVACLQVVQGLGGREHMQDDELGIIKARVGTVLNQKTSEPPLLPSLVDNEGSVNKVFLDEGGEHKQRRMDVTTVDDMDGMFNTVSNGVCSGCTTGNSIIANGDIAVFAVGVYKCSEGSCAKSDSMLFTSDLNGEVNCLEDNASCVLDGENSKNGMLVKGTGSGTLILRALSIVEGCAPYFGGGILIKDNAIVNILLCIFSNCDAGYYGGAISVITDTSVPEDTYTFVIVYGTIFDGNSATSGNDIYRQTGNIIIKDTCPSPYSSRTPTQGKMSTRCSLYIHS